MHRIGSAVCAGIVAVGAVLAPTAQAQLGNPDDPFAPAGPRASVRLALEHERLTPGPQELAVVFDIEPGWHLYWKNPGDTGMPPSVTLTLPESVTQTGEILWPMPERYVHGGGALLDYIHEGTLTLLVPIDVDAAAAGSAVTIEAEAEWLVCKEECLPESGTARLTADVRTSAGEKSAEADLFRVTRERLPRPTKRLHVGWNGHTLMLNAPGSTHMQYFPLEPDIGGPAQLVADGAVRGSTLRVRFDPRVSDAERVRGVVAIGRGLRVQYEILDETPPPAGR